MATFNFAAFTTSDYGTLLEQLAKRVGLDLNNLEQCQLAVSMLNGQLLLDLTAHVKYTL